jgi:hypothetical protein
VSNGPQSLQPDLSGGSFDRVNGAKQFVNLFRIIVSFQRNKAIADDLKMLFRFRLEKLKNLFRDLLVRRQCVEVRARRCGGYGLMEFLNGESLTSFGKANR